MAEHFKHDRLGLQILQEGFGDRYRDLHQLQNYHVVNARIISSGEKEHRIVLKLHAYVLYVVESRWIALAGVLHRLR